MNELDRQIKLNKVHGAVPQVSEFESQEPDVLTKSTLHTEQKDRIAHDMRQPRLTTRTLFFIDAGTTTLRMAEYLEGSKATFVTTGIECARRLVEKGLLVYVAGGLLKPGTQALVGAAARESIGRYNFTKAFIGTNGISLGHGYTTPDIEEASIKSLAIDHSYVSYVLADSSKFGKVSAVTIASLDKACILTDRLPDASYCKQTLVKEVD